MYIQTNNTLQLQPLYGPFVRDYPGEPVPEETFTHPPSWSSSSLYQLLPSTTSTTIHSILPVEIMCLVIFFAQPLSTSSFVYLLVWSVLPHIPYISSPSLLFAAHAHTIATKQSNNEINNLHSVFTAQLQWMECDIPNLNTSMKNTVCEFRTLKQLLWWPWKGSKDHNYD